VVSVEGAAAAAASHGTNDIEDRNLQIPVYAVSQKKTTELDSFDMSMFYLHFNICHIAFILISVIYT